MENRTINQINLEQIKFSLPEILSLFGLAQCLLIMVYMVLRAGKLSRATLPFAYFLFLGTAFSLDFAERFIGDVSDYYPLLQWIAWFSGPPLSVLLIIQIAQITKLPPLRYYWILFLVPLALFAGIVLAVSDPECSSPESCPVFMDWMVLTGLIAGTFSLLLVWVNRKIMDSVLIQNTGRDRYWLIITLILMNVLFLTTMLVRLGEVLSADESMMLRTVIGIGFVYVASTSLFRIYPPAVRDVEESGKDMLSDMEVNLALDIEKLIELDKIYHEPSYSRTDLARELGVSETVVSRIINLHFKRSFPQLLNEHRVDDAKRLLKETQASVKTIAEEVGFNSIASFNRVFKEITGYTPSSIRKGNTENKSSK